MKISGISNGAGSMMSSRVGNGSSLTSTASLASRNQVIKHNPGAIAAVKTASLSPSPLYRNRSAARHIGAALPTREEPGNSENKVLTGSAAWRAHLAHFELYLPQGHAGFSGEEAQKMHKVIGTLVESGSIDAGIEKACVTGEAESVDAMLGLIQFGVWNPNRKLLCGNTMLETICKGAIEASTKYRHKLQPKMICERVQALVDHGADVKQRDSVGNSLLHIAAQHDAHSEVLTSLIEQGLSLKSINDAGETALHTAVRHHASARLVEDLVRFGARTEQRDAQDMTALHVAAMISSKTDVLAALYYKGADINSRNKLGWTPLHYAAAFSTSPASIKFLVKHGADEKIKTINGHTPADLRTQQGMQWPS